MTGWPTCPICSAICTKRWRGGTSYVLACIRCDPGKRKPQPKRVRPTHAEVMALVNAGMPTAEVAKALHILPKNVRSHMGNARKHAA